MAEELNIKLTDIQAGQLYLFYQMLVEWNEKFNLTAITKEEDVIQKHFIDSLLISKHNKFNKLLLDGSKVIDVGTGAGFPGIPLKIAYPQSQVVLLDSLAKRVTYLNTVINGLKLDKINAYHGRAEDFGQDKAHREDYELVVSRAVAYLPVLLEYCLPFVAVGGFFIAYKSSEAPNELAASKAALNELGGKYVDSLSSTLPNGDFRSLVIIEKVKATKRTYPRKAGMPAKKPIE